MTPAESEAKSKKQRSSSHQGKERARWRAWLWPVLFGLLLGGLAIAWFSCVYNPFGTRVTTPLVLVPDDVDLVVRIPEFPRFVEELRSREFLTRVQEHGGVQRVFDEVLPEDARLFTAIGEALDAIEALGEQLPLDMEFLGGVTGQEIVAAGYLGEVPEKGGPAPIADALVYIKPQDWKTLAGANLLLSSTLSGLGVTEALAQNGIRVEHERDLVVLHPDGPKSALDRSIALIRVADVIVLATNTRHLNVIRREVDLQGLPVFPADRFTSLDTRDAEGGGALVVDLLARSEKLDALLGVESKLRDLWGDETLALATSTLPPVRQRDHLVRLRMGTALEFSVQVPVQGPSSDGIERHLDVFAREEAREGLRKVSRMLPDETFAWLAVEARPGLVLGQLLRGPGPRIADDTQLEVWNEALAEVRAINSLTVLTDQLDSLCGQSLHLAFFRQQREALEDEAEAGLLIALELQRRSDAEAWFDALARDLGAAARQGEGVVAFEQRDADGVRSLIPRLADGVLSDPRVQIPGFALIGERLILTNYAPVFEAMREVARGEAPAFEALDSVPYTLGQAPDRLSTAVVVSGQALWPWLRQSAQGWATSQTALTGVDLIAIRMQEKEVLLASGADPNSARFELDLDARVEARQAATSGEASQWLSRFRSVTDALEGLLDAAGVFVSESSDGLSARLTLRLDLRAAPAARDAAPAGG